MPRHFEKAGGMIHGAGGQLRKPHGHRVEQDSSDGSCQLLAVCFVGFCTSSCQTFQPQPRFFLKFSEFPTGKEIRCLLLSFIVLPMDVKTDGLKRSIYTCCHDGECVFLSYFPTYPLTRTPSRRAYAYISRGQQVQTQGRANQQTKSTRACARTFYRFSGRQQIVGTQGHASAACATRPGRRGVYR